MNRYLAMGIVAFSAILWGFIGYSTRAMYSAGLDAVQINGIRGIVCTVVLFVVLMLFDRSSMVIKKRRDILRFIVFGVAKFAMDVCYVQSQMCVSLALAGILLATDTYFMLIISIFLFRDGITANKVIATFVGFFGLSLVMNLYTNPGEINVEGVLYGLGSGFFGSIYAAGLKVAMNDGYEPHAVLFYVFLFGAVIYAFVMDVPYSFSVAFGTGDMVWNSVLLCFLLTLVPYYLYTKGMEYLDPITVLILLFLEAVTSALVGVLMFSESMDVLNVIGIALVLISILIMNIRLTRHRRPS